MQMCSFRTRRSQPPFPFCPCIIIIIICRLDVGDSYGHTPAHMCAYHALPKMWALISMLWTRGIGRPEAFKGISLLRIASKEGCNPFVLAGKQGHIKLVTRRMQAEAKSGWKWGNYR